MNSASAMSSVKMYRARGVRSICATVSGTASRVAEHGKDGPKGFGSKERVSQLQICHDGGWDEKFGSVRRTGADKGPFS